GHGRGDTIVSHRTGRAEAAAHEHACRPCGRRIQERQGQARTAELYNVQGSESSARLKKNKQSPVITVATDGKNAGSKSFAVVDDIRIQEVRYFVLAAIEPGIVTIRRASPDGDFVGPAGSCDRETQHSEHQHFHGEGEEAHNSPWHAVTKRFTDGRLRMNC